MNREGVVEQRQTTYASCLVKCLNGDLPIVMFMAAVNLFKHRMFHLTGWSLGDIVSIPEQKHIPLTSQNM